MSQGLTPRLQQAVRLLQMSTLDYEQELREMVARNPFLDLGSNATAQGPQGVGEDRSDEPASSTTTTPASGPDLGTDFDEHSTERLLGQEEFGPTSHDGTGVMSPDRGEGLLETMVAPTGFRDHLRAQARLLRLSARDRALVLAVVESLDDDGFLRGSLAEVSALAEGAEVDQSEYRAALKHVQSLEPAGVGARSLGECLQLQLATTPGADSDLASRIVGGHLEQLAQCDFDRIARALGHPRGEVEAACERVRRLDPRPVRRFEAEQAHYIVPDLAVRKIDGRWRASLNPAAMPELRLNQVYADLFRQHRDASHRELATQLQEARWTVRNVQQRYQTILAVAESIMKRQQAFFEHGALAMKPLSLREIADDIGAHESTVSRVTNNKFMATPAGVVELKAFLSRQLPVASGGFSSVAVRELVKEMIEAEDVSEPLSDGDIAKRLAREGVTLTRRTVSKYRTLLRVPTVDQRRRAATAALTKVRRPLSGRIALASHRL